MAELAVRAGVQPDVFDGMLRSDAVRLRDEVRKLHRDDVDLRRLCAEVSAGTRKFLT